MRYVWMALRGLLLAVLLLICAALFYLLVIMGDTPETDSGRAALETPQALQSLPQASGWPEGSDLYRAAYYCDDPEITLSDKAG